MPAPIPTNLLPTQLPRIEHAATTYLYRAPPSVTIGHLLQPGFWVHLARRLKVYDKIEAVAVDGTFDVELRVVATDPRGLWAQVALLRSYEAPPLAHPAEKDADFRVEFSNAQRWRIIDRVGNLVASDFPDEGSAIAALPSMKGPAVPRWSDPEPSQPKPAAEPVEKRAYVKKERVATGDYDVRWAGPFHKFAIYAPDGSTAAKGFGSKEQADAALENLRAARAA